MKETVTTHNFYDSIITMTITKHLPSHVHLMENRVLLCNTLELLFIGKIDKQRK